MPGICGSFSDRPQVDARKVVDQMLRAMDHSPGGSREQHHEPGQSIALGKVTPDYAGDSAAPFVLLDREVIAVMDGEVYGARQQRERLEKAGCAFTGDSATEVIARGYLAEGPQFFARLTGKFTAAVYDGRHRKLLVANDKFGMRPMYYTQVGERLLFASEIKCLLADEQVSRKPNERGIAQFFAFGQMWGEDTMYAAVRVLPAAACLVWDCDSRQLQVDKYWHLSEPGKQDPKDAMERLDAAFKQAVDVRSLGAQHAALALSGGLDARTILGVVDHQKVKLDCVTLGMPGSMDSRTSRQLADIAGYPYHDFLLKDDFLSSFEGHLNRMVELTDGHYLSQCIVMPTLELYRNLGVKVLLRGHAGELMHMWKAYNFSLTPDVLNLSGDQELPQWLFSHLSAYMLENVDEPLFEFADAAEIDDLSRQSLTDSLAETSEWTSTINRISHLFVSQRTRRETAMSLVKFASVTETRLPYVDENVIASILAMPAESRLGEDLQAAILRKHCPAFLKPVNTNTGAAVGAGKATRAVQLFKKKVFAKLGVPGYQPYERLGLWLRRELQPLVRSLLLDERCLDRGVFRAGTVRRVVDQHMSNEKNHTYLLLAMMIFETGQRQFADGQPGSTARRPHWLDRSTPVAKVKS